ncbi:MAG: VCBS repeat-containing protein [Planctomycetota bacterium]
MFARLSNDPIAAAALSVIVFSAAACGGSDPAPARSGAPPVASSSDSAETRSETVVSGPKRVVLPEIERALRGPVDNEALAEALDGWLGTVGNKVRIRDFDGISAAFADGFVGERLFADVDVDAEGATPLPMGVQRVIADPPQEALDRDGFMAALEDSISPWTRVAQSSWRLAQSRFQRPPRGETVEWGLADIRIHIVGHPADGGTVVLDALATAAIRNVAGEWRMTHFQVTERKLLLHARPMFSEVSRAVGVAYDGLRYGEPGNDGDGWNGVAAADVDGDGLLDVFVPGAQKGFLYRADGDGGFVEEAEVRGLGALGGGTGAVFFDYDRDGDQDLAVAFIGWRKLDDSPAGRALGLYENDGKGVFRDVSRATGFARHRLPAYSLTAFDADGDGFTDLFACGYGRMDAETNDSWIEASNGASDLLLRNVGGERFEDVTARAGLEDRRWSYASAAADFDEDGDVDLYVGNNFGTSRLYRNRGDGTFEDVAEELGVNVRGNVMGVIWTDLNGDGRLDLYLSSPTSTSGSRLLSNVEEEFGTGSAQGMMQMANGNKLFLGAFAMDPENPNDTRAGFVQAGQGSTAYMGGLRAGWSWSAASPDVDLDGHRDIVCVNGFVTGEVSGDT